MVKCSMCQRQFKTAAALKQHRLASHPAGPSPRVQPVPARRPRRNQTPSTGMAKQTSSGTDGLGVFPVTMNHPVGAILANFAINPTSVGVSRLATESTLWARWRPKKLILRIVCSGAATTFGGIVAGWTPEEAWQPSLMVKDGQRIASFKPSVVMRLNETRSFAIPCETLTKWYLTDGERGLSNHGTVVVAVSAATGGYTGSVSVGVYLDWSIEFEGPDVELRTLVQDVIKPDAGWSSLFTTSDSSFNSERLTFKMHSGGSMCPFSSARLDRVYVCAASSPATEVYYYDESGAEKKANAFARVQGYATPGLLCFASEKDASEYVRTGDVTKALKYNKAGKVCVPPVPTFVGRKPTTSLHEAVNVLLDADPSLYDMDEFIAVLGRLGLPRTEDISSSRSSSAAVSSAVDSADPQLPGGDDPADPRPGTSGQGVIVGPLPAMPPGRDKRWGSTQGSGSSANQGFM